MSKTMQGTIHGRTIELSEELGLTDGQPVEVSVRPIVDAPVDSLGNGLLRTEGALADDPHWDGIMDEIAKSRKLERQIPAGGT